MLRHIVMWSLLDFAGERDRTANALLVKGELEGLRDKIPQILHLEVGINALNHDVNWHVVLVSEFADEHALQAYQDHPEHKRVAALIAGVRSSRTCVDYVI